MCAHGFGAHRGKAREIKLLAGDTGKKREGSQLTERRGFIEVLVSRLTLLAVYIDLGTEVDYKKGMKTKIDPCPITSLSR